MGIPDVPILATDPARQQEILDSFKNRLEYLARSYLLAFDAMDREGRSFNASLKRLKVHIRQLGAGNAKPFEQSEDTRLHPELELLINTEARKLADISLDDRLGPEHQAYVDAAAANVALVTTARRGAPNRALLRHFVAGVVALIVEVSGLPVIGQRSKNSVYEPSLGEPTGQVVRNFVSRVEPGLSDTAIVTMIRIIRKEYAGKKMRFSTLFPFYDGRVDDGRLLPSSGCQLEAFIPIVPIYCP
jgi:hypothetical protein